MTPNKLQIERLLSRTGDVALRRRAAWILQQLDLKKGDRVLDLGCGDGFYLHLLTTLNPEVSLIGVDPDTKALRSARVNLRGKDVEFKKASIYKLPFRTSSFKFVIMSEVLEHLIDEDRGLREIYRVLKPGGMLLISVPHSNYPFLWDPINWCLQRLTGTHISDGFWAGIWNQHQRLYSQEQLVDKLKSNHFRRIKVMILTQYCLPFNHHLLNLAARFLVRRRSSKLGQMISKFNTGQKDGMLGVNPFLLFFKIDQLNDRKTYSSVGVSIVASGIK